MLRTPLLTCEFPTRLVRLAAQGADTYFITMANDVHSALNLSTPLGLGTADPEVTMAALVGLINLTFGSTTTDADMTTTWTKLFQTTPSTTTVRQFKGLGGHPMVRSQQARNRASAMRESIDAWSVPPQDMIPDNAWIAFQVLHTLLTIIALIINCTSLGVIYGIVTKLTPPLQILTSLAFSDMLAPWAIMTMYFPSSSCQDEIHTALLITSHNASALTLLALAMVHNIATFRPLNYDKIVTQKRLWITINLIWITSIISAHIHFLAALAHHDPRLPFCIQVLHNTKMALSMSLALLSTAVIVSALIYARILLHLRPIGMFASQDSVSPRKSTRGVITGVILAACFLIIWVPYLATKFVNVHDSFIRDRGVLIGLNVCQVFILIMNIANPIIYGVRMASMQNGYLTLYHKLRGCAILTWHRLTSRGRHDEMPSTPLNPIESIC